MGSDGLAGVTAIETRLGAVTFSVLVPVIDPEAAVIVVAPCAMAMAKPAAVMPATPVEVEVQVTDAVMSCVVPSVYVPVAENCCVKPAVIDGFCGATAIDTSVAGMPTPLRVTLCGELVVLSVKVSVPVLVPVDFGENVTEAVQLAFAASVPGLSGHVVVSAKSAPETVTLVIVRAFFWLFVSVTVCGGLVVPSAWPA